MLLHFAKRTRAVKPRSRSTDRFLTRADVVATARLTSSCNRGPSSAVCSPSAEQFVWQSPVWPKHLLHRAVRLVRHYLLPQFFHGNGLCFSVSDIFQKQEIARHRLPLIRDVGLHMTMNPCAPQACLHAEKRLREHQCLNPSIPTL